MSLDYQMRQEKTIVLLNFCNGMYGGIESFLLNAFYCLDKQKYRVTFLTCGCSTYSMFREDIVFQGGQVEEIPILADTYSKKYRLYIELKKYFKKNKPDIVHVNTGTFSLQFLAAKAAKTEGVKRVILHSHNFLPNKIGIKENVKNLLKRKLVEYGDSFLACSSGAALWMFPRQMVVDNQVTIIPNGIDTKRFIYSEDKRKKFRAEFRLRNELVIGNIGRFQMQKNHRFMLQIMAEVIKRDSTAKLLLVGEGPLKEDIKNEVIKKNLHNNIIFLGERRDMDAFFSALDVFILPSLYEGLPIASIEAQASGVKTLLSERITKEANVSGSAIYLPISGKDAEKVWAEAICNQLNPINRINENKKVFDAGFDVHVCYKKMIDIYGEDPVDVNNR